VSEHSGLLGALTEACQLQQTLGLSWAEALEVQRRLHDERQRELEQEAEGNIVWGTDFRKDRK